MSVKVKVNHMYELKLPIILWFHRNTYRRYIKHVSRVLEADITTRYDRSTVMFCL